MDGRKLAMGWLHGCRVTGAEADTDSLGCCPLYRVDGRGLSVWQTRASHSGRCCSPGQGLSSVLPAPPAA